MLWTALKSILLPILLIPIPHFQISALRSVPRKIITLAHIFLGLVVPFLLLFLGLDTRYNARKSQVSATKLSWQPSPCHDPLPLIAPPPPSTPSQTHFRLSLSARHRPLFQTSTSLPALLARLRATQIPHRPLHPATRMIVTKIKMLRLHLCYSRHQTPCRASNLALSPYSR